MKLRQLPSDFIVDEVSNFTPDPAGRFFVYRLDKQSLSTFEALEIIAKRSGLKPKQLSASGLKDKHGATTQLFSSDKPLKAEVEDERITVTFLGKSAVPLTAAFIDANRFKLVLRALSADEAGMVRRNADELLACGVPNYYDNQRFGSNTHGQGFIAKALIEGQYEEALHRHMAVPHRKQSLRDKQNRRLAAELWGRWEELRPKMKKSPEQALVAFLCKNPGAYAECFERITPSLRIMYIAAYQSLLFNETVRRFMQAEEQRGIKVVHVQNRAGYIPMHRALPADKLEHWRTLEFPLLGLSSKAEDFKEAWPYARETLAAEGIELEQLRLTGLQRTRFKAARRKLLLTPQDLVLGAPVPDDLNAGRHKVETSFTLPRGSFATIIARRLVLLDGRQALDDDA